MGYSINQAVYLRNGYHPIKAIIAAIHMTPNVNLTYDLICCSDGSKVSVATEDCFYAIPSLQNIRIKKRTCFIEAKSREDVVKMAKGLATYDDEFDCAVDIWDKFMSIPETSATLTYEIKDGKINGWACWAVFARLPKTYGEGYKLEDVLQESANLNTKEDNKMKFKVGDNVIGNEDASSHYTITNKGWIGKVISIDDDIIRVRGKDYFGYDSDFTVEAEHFDLYTGDIPTKAHKLRFEITEGERYVSHGKHKGETIPTITTVVFDDTMGDRGSATCDKSDYNERQGIIEAIANMTYGNFDREYNKFLNHKREVENALCKCSTCGKTYKTKEEARACEQAHIDRKKAKRENYLMRKAAKKRAREMQVEQMAKDMIKGDKI